MATDLRLARSAVKVSAGKLSVSGTALISGTLPKSFSGKPKSFALSKNTTFGAGDSFVGAVALKAPKGSYKAWISLADDAPTGTLRLLACEKATPSAPTCTAVGTAHVGAAAAPVVATPKLETSRMVSRMFNGRAASLTATGSDGTKYTIKVPASDAIYPIELTPVSSLSPASAAGKLVDGVMITPLGEAPPGSTLVIKPGKKTPPKNAQIIGFGGIETSGAAFPLAIPFGKTATIPLAALGGYGIAVPVAKSSIAVQACPSAPDVLAAAQPAASGSRPLISCSSAEQRMKQLGNALIKELGIARQELLLGQEPSANIGEMFVEAGTADTQALEDEAGRLLNQPPTDQGSAELEVLTMDALSIARQSELTDQPHDQIDQLIDQMLNYRLKNLHELCMGGGPQPAIQLLAHAMLAFGTILQARTLDDPALGNEAGTIRSACLRRVKINVDITDSSEFDDNTLDVSAAVTADNVMVTGHDDAKAVGGVSLKANDVTLTYDSASVSVDPPLSEVETAEFTSKSGLVHVGTVGYSASTKVRCDKNKQFVYDYKASIWADPSSLWQDVQKVQISVEGTVVGNNIGGVEGGSFSEGIETSKILQPFEIKLDTQPPTELKNGGACPSANCKKFSYDATFDATSQDG